MDKYTIADGSSLSELITSVNVLIESGYSPVGEVSHILGSYIQAMFYNPEGASKCHVSSPRVRYHSSNCPFWGLTINERSL